METAIKRPVIVSDMKQRLADINLSVSWMDFALSERIRKAAESI